MQKIKKILENISLGLFVNGSFIISQDELTMNTVIMTAIVLYAMIMTAIFEEDKLEGQDFTILIAIIATALAFVKAKRNY